MADPLSLLREYNVNKKDIIERNNQIIFGWLSWSKNVKTNYIKFEKGSLTKDYYTLECLLFILKNVHLIHPEYCRQAAANNIQAVRRPDRKKLLAYLNGETDSNASIDKKAPWKKPNQLKRKPDCDISKLEEKKPRIEDIHLQTAEQSTTLVKTNKESVTNNNIKKGLVTDDNIKKESVTDDNIKKESVTNVNIKQESVTDVNIKQETVTDVNMKQESVTDVNIKKEMI